MIEIKELVIRAMVDAKAEKPRDEDSTDSEKTNGECEACESVEQIIESLKNKNER